MSDWTQKFVDRYEAVLFDVGNTLVVQSLPMTPIDEIEVLVLPGVRESISQLAGRVSLGLISNTSSMTANDIRELLATVSLSDPFAVVIATSELGIHKPDPTPLLVAAAQLGVNPNKCLYVGDSESDEVAAKSASMDFCFTGPDLHWVLQRFAGDFSSPIERALSSQRDVDIDARVKCEEEIGALAKPHGSLGILEPAAIRLAGIQRRMVPVMDPIAAAIFVADHGIAEGNDVTPWPWTITRDIAGLMAKGKAAASAFAQVSDVFLEIVNVGIATGETPEGVRHQVVREGTRDLRDGRTMTREEVLESLEVGVATAARLVAGGSRVLCVGEVGIGNTTSSSAIISFCTEIDPHLATGYGSGIPEDAFLRKREIVAAAVSSLEKTAGGFEVLERMGGLEIAAMVGFMIESASLGVPVILDGVITLSAACIAEKLCPGISTSFLASHQSPEPATRAALEFLSLDPLVNLGMRVGEGTGALAVVPLLRSMCFAISKMARISDL